jgi:penicillin-binding protein 1C
MHMSAICKILCNIRLNGLIEFLVHVAKNLRTSFPRRRESSGETNTSPIPAGSQPLACAGMTNRRKTIYRMRILPVVTAGAFLFLWITWRGLLALFPFPQERLQQEQSGGATEILDREGGLISWRIDTGDNWRVPIGLEQVSPWLISASVAAEDQRFWNHGGVDPLAVCRAAAQNLRHGRRVSGASTITMQSIRLLFDRNRTWSAKLSETFRALQIEKENNKETILQLYLNLAPYGGNVVGAEAAARHYFGKPASELTLGEAALLAGIPQSPARFNPRKHLDVALKRREFVLERMQTLGLATNVDRHNALREPICLSNNPRKTPAPRFADFILQQSRHNGGIIQTTIAPHAQAIATAVLEKQYRDIHSLGIDGIAAVVIDVPEASLAAMVGNAAPDNPVTGWLNGATALRQPGSLLKPFLFALAYEAGRLTPDAAVYDVPSSWHGYQPENMDREYLGSIPAAEALRLSRNIPAVRLLDAVGEETLARKMNALGLHPAAPAARYGLSLALGTAEMRLLDLANAYAALARLGQYLPLRVLAGEASPEKAKVFSPGAAWLTLRSLGAADSGAPCRPVWKTGTSWNQRDAWAVVLAPRRIVAVWCGCLSGVANSKLTGAEAALPVALEIMGQLENGHGESWVRPADISVRKVCALTGAPVGMACPHTVDGEYLPGVSDDNPCRVHRPVCREGMPKTRIEWPPEITRFLSSSRATTIDSPPRGIAILSPRPEGQYLISPDDEKRHLEFIADAEPDGKVFWYLDGSMLGVSTGREPLAWVMREGEHEVIAADSQSANYSVSFRVSRISLKSP